MIDEMRRSSERLPDVYADRVMRAWVLGANYLKLEPRSTRLEEIAWFCGIFPRSIPRGMPS